MESTNRTPSRHAAGARVAGSCIVLILSSCSRLGPAAFEARAVADLSLTDLLPAQVEPRHLARPVDAFAPGLGLCAGMASYPTSGPTPIEPRTMLGAYLHFGEDEVQRGEGEVAFLPSSVEPADSHYWSVGLKYVRFMGRGGYAHWGVGGGVLLERWHGQTGGAPFAGLSLGWWVPFGAKGLDVRVEFQTLIGDEVGAPYIVAACASYDL